MPHPELSHPQTLKSVKINSSKKRQMTVHALVPQCAEPRKRSFQLLRIQNTKKFPGLRHWTPLGGTYSATSIPTPPPHPDSPPAQRFFSSLRSPAPQKFIYSIYTYIYEYRKQGKKFSAFISAIISSQYFFIMNIFMHVYIYIYIYIYK